MIAIISDNRYAKKRIWVESHISGFRFKEWALRQDILQLLAE